MISVSWVAIGCSDFFSRVFKVSEDFARHFVLGAGSVSRELFFRARARGVWRVGGDCGLHGPIRKGGQKIVFFSCRLSIHGSHAGECGNQRAAGFSARKGGFAAGGHFEIEEKKQIETHSLLSFFTSRVRGLTDTSSLFAYDVLSQRQSFWHLSTMKISTQYYQYPIRNVRA